MMQQIVNSALPDLIVLDMMLPSESGLSVLEKLKSDINTRRVPIAVFTGLECQKTEHKARELGVLAYIQKGKTEYNIVSISRLLGRIKKGLL